VKVDGFSVGAVMGFSEQHTIICLATDEEITNFKQVRWTRAPASAHCSTAAFVGLALGAER
jgi:lipid-binding SYLF domain-containing protein